MRRGSCVPCGLFLLLTVFALPNAFPQEGAPPPPAPPAFAFSEWERAEQDDRTALYKTEYRIERADLGAQAMLQRAEAALKAGSHTDAIALGEAAARFSPDTPFPHFFLAHAHWATLAPMDAIAHYYQGIRAAFRDFWFFLSGIGISLLVLWLAFILSVLTVLIYAVVVWGRLWAHQIVEASKGRLHAIAAGFLVVLICALPLMLRLPPLWFFIFSLLLFWGFYRRAERQIVVLFLIVVALASFGLPYVTSFFSAKQSPLLRAMAQNAQNETFLIPPIRNGDVDWRSDVLSAAYEMRSGQHAIALSLYEKAFSQQPESALILSNMGNTYYHMQEYAKAVEQYQQALAGADDQTAILYNMGQTYREMLLFAEGETKYQEAVDLNAAATERYAKAAVTYPTHPLVEARFTRADVWREVLSNVEIKPVDRDIWGVWAGGLSLEKTPIVMGLVLVGLMALSPFLKKRQTATFCATCPACVCAHCWEQVLDYAVCKTCSAQFKSLTRTDDLRILEGGKKVAKKDYVFLLLPGLAQRVKGKPWTAFLFFMSFYAIVSYLWIGDALFSATQWHLRGGGVLMGLCLLLVYGASILQMMRTRRR